MEQDGNNRVYLGVSLCGGTPGKDVGMQMEGNSVLPETNRQMAYRFGNNLEYEISIPHTINERRETWAMVHRIYVTKG